MQITNSFNLNSTNDSNYINALINNKLMQVNTLFPAKILSCNNNMANIETIVKNIPVNQPTGQVLQIDNVPVCSLQGNGCGIIINYAVGDIVLCGVSQRDISMIKKAWSAQQPASNRKFCLSDAIVITSLNNTPPTTNITINPNNVVINGANVAIGNNANSNVLTKDSVILDSQGKQCTIQTFSNSVKVSL